MSWGSALYSFALFVAPVESELSLSRAQTSLAFSLALLIQGLAAHAVGRWIDAGYERIVMTGGSLLAALGLTLHGFASTQIGFYAAWMLIGLSMAATLYQPVFAVVTRRFPHSYRRAIIMITFLGGLASTVFIPLTAWLIVHGGWRFASWVLGAINLGLCAPLHFVLLRHAPRQIKLNSSEQSRSIQTNDSLKSHLRGPVFWRMGVFIVLLMAVAAAVPPHLVTLLHESGLPMAWAIALPASIGALQVLGRLVLYWGERYLNVHVTNRWIPTLIPLGLLTILVGSGHIWAGLLFTLLYGIGNGLLTIVQGTVIAQYVSAAQVGVLNGALGLPLALVRAVVPLVVGLLWTPQQGYTMSLGMLLALSVLGIAALWQGQRYAMRRVTLDL
jgi:hypothetical protein